MGNKQSDWIWINGRSVRWKDCAKFEKKSTKKDQKSMLIKQKIRKSVMKQKLEFKD